MPGPRVTPSTEAESPGVARWPLVGRLEQVHRIACRFRTFNWADTMRIWT